MNKNQNVKEKERCFKCKSCCKINKENTGNHFTCPEFFALNYKQRL